MIKFSWVVLALFLISCGHSYPVAQARLSADQSVYHLRANDVVMVRVYDEAELTGKYTIDSQGKIALPLIGKVSILHQTEQQAAETLRQRLQSGGYLTNPKVAIEIAQARPFFVLGEVEKSGSFPFQPGMTVYQAVALAGGYTYRADRDDITLRRQTTDGAGAEQRYSATEDTPVLPGDSIEIGERYF